VHEGTTGVSNEYYAFVGVMGMDTGSTMGVRIGMQLMSNIVSRMEYSLGQSGCSEPEVQSSAELGLHKYKAGMNPGRRSHDQGSSACRDKKQFSSNNHVDHLCGFITLSH
jgi:hypothetical protein